LKEYVVYLQQFSEDGNRTFLAIDENEVCRDLEEVVRRVLCKESEITLNLFSMNDEADMRQKLAMEGFEVHPERWLEDGVPDLLILDEDGEQRFVEVKSATDGLRSSQFEWAVSKDEDLAVAWVMDANEVNSSLDDVETVTVSERELYDLSRTYEGERIVPKRVRFISYGNHSASSATRVKASKILRRLRDNGLVRRDELMRTVGLDPDSDSDRSSFSNLLAPLRGSNRAGPLNIRFIARELVEGDPYYRLSRVAFDASFEKLRRDILYLMEDLDGSDRLPDRVLDQLIALSYGNHAKTGQQREDARVLIKYLVRNGESTKQELMRAIDLDPGSESDDKRFLRTVQWLTGNWEKERKNPLHVSDRDFVLGRRVAGSTSYYRLSPEGFRRSTNQLRNGIRKFLSQDLERPLLRI
jgi:hypothetical protein